MRHKPATAPTAPPPLTGFAERLERTEAQREQLFINWKAALEFCSGNITQAALAMVPPITRDRGQYLTRNLGLSAYASSLRHSAGGTSVFEGELKGKVMGRPKTRKPR